MARRRRWHHRRNDDPVRDDPLPSLTTLPPDPVPPRSSRADPSVEDRRTFHPDPFRPPVTMRSRPARLTIPPLPTKSLRTPLIS